MAAAQLRVLDLFSGIGAFSLGLERAGMCTVAFCESDAYCRRVLARHWPEVPCYDDVRTLTAARLAADGIAVDVICGGFPCQDISVAGRGVGITGERSGLWSEFARLIGELRPRYAIVENVAALLSRGLGDVLGDLAALGYDAEWHCIPAAAVGAPHRRDRIWIIGYPDSDGKPAVSFDAALAVVQGDVAYAARVQPGRSEQWSVRERTGECGEPEPVAYPALCGCGARRQGRPVGVDQGLREQALADACGARLSPSQRAPILTAWWWHEGRAVTECGWWSAEPDVGRVAHGVAARVDRLRCLGNALVPQIPELIGRAILAAARG